MPRAQTASVLEIADRLHSAAIHLLREVAREDAGSGISAARLSALSVLTYAGPMSVGALAAVERVTHATMSRLVDGLEAARLARRRPDPVDRRGVIVHPTARGTNVLMRARRRRIDRLAERLGASASPADLAVLERAAALVERAVGGRP